MRKTVFFLFVFQCFAFACYCQDEGSFDLPDTFHIYKFENIKVLNTLDSLDVQVIDTIKPDGGYILQLKKSQYGFPEWTYLAALKIKNSYKIFAVFENSEVIYGSLNNSNCHIIQNYFNKHSVLVVNFNTGDGMSSWGGGYGKSTKNIILVDITHLKRIMELEYEDIEDHWENEYEKTVIDSSLNGNVGDNYYNNGHKLDTSIDNGSYCYNYDIELLKNKITLTQDNTPCEEKGKGEKPNSQPIKIIYRYTKKGFIREK